MRIEQLKYLIEIDRSGSINEAAKRLHISHQGISIAIKALEDELGVLLVKRSYKGTTLTAKGKYVVRAAVEFFQKIERLNNFDKHSESTMRGTLSIVSTYFAAERFLPSIIIAYYDRYPKMKINNTYRVPKEVILSFAERKYDLAFLSMLLQDAKSLSDAMDLTFVPCAEIKTYIEVSNFSVLAQYQSISINALKNYQLIYNCSTETADAQKNNWPFRYIRGKSVRCEASPRIYRELLLNDTGVGISGSSKNMPLKRQDEDVVMIPVRDAPMYYFGYLSSSEPFTISAQNFLQLL